MSSLDHKKVFKKKTTMFWLLQITGWFFYLLVDYITIFLDYETFKNNDIFYNKLVFVLTGFIISVFFYFIYKRISSSKYPLFLIIGITLLCSLLGSAIWFVSCEIIILKRSFSEMIIFLRMNPIFNISYFINLCFILLLWSSVYFGVRYWFELQEQKELTLRANAHADKSKLQMLRYQVNPHFLFNSLNSIHGLIGPAPGQAEEMVEELSDFLRSSLINKIHNDVLLKDEINLITSYLAIEKIRFQKNLEYSIDIDPSIENYVLPSFIIHPLIENAIKYGMKTSKKPLKINIIGKQNKLTNSIEINVSNSGTWINMKDSNDFNSTKIGLQNIKERLQLIYKDTHNFSINESDGFVSVSLSLSKNRIT